MGQILLEIWDFHSASILLIARNLITAILILVIGRTLSKGAQRLIKRASSSDLHVDETVTSLLRGIVRYGIFIVSVIMVLNVFGVNTTSLLAVLGAAGVAIGLALKDTLGNIASGIIILFMGSYRKGDFIEFGSFMGTVQNITLFTTILETPDGIHISAPNSCIWGTPLRNYTRNGKRRMDLSVGIAYSDSVDMAFQVMRDIIAAEPRLLKEPAPQVILQSLESSSVIITVRAWASTKDYWDIYWELNKTIKAKIEGAGLHIPFPHVRVVRDD
ncbi:MAG: mechanosensitive ion channel family protein [Treponema sp.]|jgi:small conductance mechanosensitive channel|nr:mechanosensitive ion channel family protein [Treponema sp.]